MQSSARGSYLETEVMTATPQKLQLMMIEAAIRAAQRTLLAWQEDQQETAGDSLVKAQQIMGELLASLNPEVDADLTRRVAAVYTFIFRRLAEAGIQRDEEKLADAIRILKIERETWLEVCKQLGSTKEPDDRIASQSNTVAAGPISAPIQMDTTELPSRPVTIEDVSTGGFSLDA